MLFKSLEGNDSQNAFDWLNLFLSLTFSAEIFYLANAVVLFQGGKKKLACQKFHYGTVYA